MICVYYIDGGSGRGGGRKGREGLKERMTKQIEQNVNNSWIWVKDTQKFLYYSCNCSEIWKHIKIKLPKMWLKFFFKEMKTEFITNRCSGKEFLRDCTSKRKYNNPRRKVWNARRNGEQRNDKHMGKSQQTLAGEHNINNNI